VTRRAGGFTLLELLVVLALISLLVAIVTPSFFNDRTRSFNAAVQTAIQALRRARRESVVERRSRSVLFGDADSETDDDLVVWAHPDIEVELADEGGEGRRQVARIRFFPDGSSDGGTLMLRGNGLSRRILISPETGRIGIADE